MYSVTPDPAPTDWPAGGYVLVAYPFGIAFEFSVKRLATVSPAPAMAVFAAFSARPLTGGTVTFPGPCDTMIVTVEPFVAFVSGSGLCLITVPAGTVEVSLITLGVK